MTDEERFPRIEHITAALYEDRKRDREEYKQLWRETDRRLAETNSRIAETNVALTAFIEESRASSRRLEERIERLAVESREADRRLETVSSRSFRHLASSSPSS